MKAPRTSILPYQVQSEKEKLSRPRKVRDKKTLDKTTLDNYSKRSSEVIEEKRKELQELYQKRKSRGFSTHVLDLEVVEELLEKKSDRSGLTQLVSKYNDLNRLQELDQIVMGRIPQDEQLRREYDQLQKEIQNLRRLKTQELINQENQIKRQFFLDHNIIITQQVRDRAQSLPSDEFPVSTQLESQVFPSTQRVTADLIIELLEANGRMEKGIETLNERIKLIESGDLRIRESRFRFLGEGPFAQIGVTMRNDPIFQILRGTFMVSDKGYAYMYDVMNKTFLYLNSNGYLVRQTEQSQFYILKDDYPDLFEKIGQPVPAIYYDSESGIPFILLPTQEQDSFERINLNQDVFGVLKPLFIFGE